MKNKGYEDDRLEGKDTRAFPERGGAGSAGPHPGPRAGSRSRAAATSLSLSPRPENVCRLRFKKRTRH